MDDDAFGVEGIDHVELVVPDRYEAAEWYERILGLSVCDKDCCTVVPVIADPVVGDHRYETTPVLIRPMARPVRFEWDDHEWSELPRSHDRPKEQRTDPSTVDRGGNIASGES